MGPLLETAPENLITIRLQLFEFSCKQTNK